MRFLCDRSFLLANNSWGVQALPYPTSRCSAISIFSTMDFDAWLSPLKIAMGHEFSPVNNMVRNRSWPTTILHCMQNLILLYCNALLLNSVGASLIRLAAGGVPRKVYTRGGSGALCGWLGGPSPAVPKDVLPTRQQHAPRQRVAQHQQQQQRQRPESAKRGGSQSRL